MDKLTFKVTKAVDKPFFFGKKDDSLILKPEDAMKELGHVAGPFEKLEGGAVIKIDPREE